MNEMNRVPNGYRESEEDRPIDLRDLWFKFLRRRRLFLIIAIPIFLGIVIYQFTKPYSPIYRAAFDIGVTQEKPVEGIFTGISDLSTIQIGPVTQRVISNLMSINLAAKVADSLSMYAHVKNGNSDVKVFVQFKPNSDIEKPIGPLKLTIKDNRFYIGKNGDALVDGSLNEFVDAGVFKIKVLLLTPLSKNDNYQLTIYPRNKIALALRNSVSVNVLEADKIETENRSKVPFSGEGASKRIVTANPRVYDTNIGILRINVLWGNPKDAKQIADEFSRAIIEEDKTQKSLQYVQSRVFIDSQLIQYQDKLTRLEEEVQLFKEIKKITDLKASTQALISQISLLESRRSQLEIEDKILTELDKYLTDNGGDGSVPNFASAMVSDPALQNLYSQLLNVEAEMRTREKEYAVTHPKVLEVKAKFDGLKDQMKEEINKRGSSINAEIRSVSNQILILQSKLTNVPEDEIQLARLERDKATAEKLYTFFAERLEETRVQEAGVTSALRIINSAAVHDKPVNSRGRMRAGIIAIIISILAGVFAVFIVEYFDNKVKDPNLISEKLGLPVFASIPALSTEEPVDKRVPASGGRRRSARPPQEGVTREGQKSYLWYFAKKLFSDARGLLKINGIVSDTGDNKEFKFLDPKQYSAEFEAFRKLAINLEFAHPEKEYRVIYITSSGPDEGKTFISLNLAHVQSYSNKKTIVVDTDFRKKHGSVTDIVNMRKKPGLFEVLKGETSLDEAITQYSVPLDSTSKHRNIKTSDSSDGSDALRSTPYALRILPVGKIPPNPFTFLDSDNMKKLIAELKSKYDYVLVDGVPLIIFADASYLANFADGVMLTARYDRTALKELEYSRDMLNSSKSNIIGIVMNGVPKTQDGYYYYHHYYYHKYYPKYYSTEKQ